MTNEYIVHESLNNALESGYAFDGWTIEDIACDLLDCTDIEMDHKEVVVHVSSWILKNEV